MYVHHQLKAVLPNMLFALRPLLYLLLKNMYSLDTVRWHGEHASVEGLPPSHTHETDVSWMLYMDNAADDERFTPP